MFTVELIQWERGGEWEGEEEREEEGEDEMATSFDDDKRANGCAFSTKAHTFHTRLPGRLSRRRWNIPAMPHHSQIRHKRP